MTVRAGEDGARTVRRIVLLLIAGTAVVRFWLASATGLGIDESYMVGNARQFFAGYVDHPPLHVWIVWATVHVFGSEAPLVVRAPFILLFAGSTWLLFRLTERLFGASAGLWAAIAFNLAPVFSLADATWVLPDGPMIFFLLAAANVVARILFETPADAPAAGFWVLAGVLGGLALLSKFTAVFFFLGVLVFLLSVPGARRRLRTVGPWLGCLAALVILSPALIWNAQHGFAGILFQSGRLATPGFRPDQVAIAAGGALAYLAPWLGVPFAISLIAALRRGPGEPRGWFLALAAVGPVVTFLVAALFARALPHWQMAGWLFAVPLFGRDAAALDLRRPRFARAYMAVAAVLFVLLIGAFAVQATRGGLVPEAAIAANPSIDPTIDLVDWSPLVARVAAERATNADLVVAATSWIVAGKASYVLGSDVPVLCLCDDPQQFAYRLDAAAFAGRDALVVALPGDQMADAGAYFAALEPLPPAGIARGGQTVLTLDLALGRGLRFP